MKKLLITGPGSVVYIKKRKDSSYKESHIFLNSIDSISINGKEVLYGSIEINDLVGYLGYKPGDTHLKWIIDEETGGTFNLGVEFILPDDAVDYRVLVPFFKNDSRFGDLYLVDIVNVNGEDFLTQDTILPEGLSSPDIDA